jgi:hypothetical protein
MQLQAVRGAPEDGPHFPPVEPPDHDDSDPHAPKPQTQTALKFEAGRVVLARPWHELWAQICNHCELPSWELIARAITVLFKFIFCQQGHFHDHVILVRPEGFYHSTSMMEPGAKGVSRVPPERDKTIVFEERFPDLLDQALYLKHASGEYDPSLVRENHSSMTMNYQGNLVSIPDFSGYEAIDAEAVRNYYHNYYGYRITHKEEALTIDDLVASPHFVEAADLGNSV